MKKWLPYLLVVIILVGGVWYIRTHERKQPAREISNQSANTIDAKICSDFRQVANVVKSLKGNSEPQDIDSATMQKDFPYKRLGTEPYVVYESNSSVAYTFQPDSLNRIQTALINKAVPEFAKLGIERDVSQDMEQTNGFDKNNLDRAFVTGFKKGEDRYVVIVDNLTSGERDIIEVYIACGRIDINQDKFYNDFIKNSLYLTSQVIGPVTEKEGLYMLSVHSGYAGGGGVTEYWIFKNSQPNKILTSQDYPPCSLLQENKVGKGLDCMNFDTGDNTVRKVSY